MICSTLSAHINLHTTYYILWTTAFKYHDSYALSGQLFVITYQTFFADNDKTFYKQIYILEMGRFSHYKSIRSGVHQVKGMQRSHFNNYCTVHFEIPSPHTVSSHIVLLPLQTIDQLFYTAVRRYHEEGNLQKKAFNWASSARGLGSMTAEERLGFGKQQLGAHVLVCSRRKGAH